MKKKVLFSYSKSIDLFYYLIDVLFVHTSLPTYLYICICFICTYVYADIFRQKPFEIINMIYITLQYLVTSIGVGDKTRKNRWIHILDVSTIYALYVSITKD